MSQTTCELCQGPATHDVASTQLLRVVQVHDAAFPGFFRVIWNEHVSEFSDLSEAHRLHCMNAVALVERALRRHLNPSKINLASLGNMVPHLHWHVIARFQEDTHFPHPIWGQAQRPTDEALIQRVKQALPLVSADIAAAFSRH